MNQYAVQISYTDRDPYEVVRVISDKTIEVRAMDAERDTSVELQWAVGGFAGHCLNQWEQKWHITSNPANPVIRLRLSRVKGWQDKHGQRFMLADRAIKFHDFNF